MIQRSEGLQTYFSCVLSTVMISLLLDLIIVAGNISPIST
jgi:hypothetical protein